MIRQTLRLRPAGLEDAKRLFDWLNDPGARAGAIGLAERGWDDHLTWLERSLARTDRLLFIGVALRTDQCIGLVRFDAVADGLWEIRVIVAPDYRGRGWARKLLTLGLEHCGAADFIARVPSGADRARSLFGGLGFVAVSEADGVVAYRLTRREAA